jgi:hypothetical protein
MFGRRLINTGSVSSSQWNIDGGLALNSDADPNSQGSFINTGFQFSQDGLSCYSQNEDPNNQIYKYTLSTAFDLSTMNLNSTANFDPANSGGRDFKFYDNGNKMLISTYSSENILTYDLSSPYDITSASNLRTKVTPPQRPMGVSFLDDGNKFVITDFTNSTNLQIYMYSLSIAYDITSTFTLVSNVNLTTAVTGLSDARGRGIIFQNDGTQCILTQQTVANTNNVLLINFSSPFDLTSTKTYVCKSANGLPGAPTIVNNNTQLAWGDYNIGKFRIFDIL